ncbi:MAG: hypothetical protein A2520_03150 [Deltaproteobacteria bacterium RIFOXYD12_FULL_53_23]|nr:MAG: hypothetical protein A2520_03150 [Deltaproteobacteria bacterium RIFOXYD12_FULL_53_23]
MSKLLLTLLLFTALAPALAVGDELRPVPGVIHLESRAGGSPLTVEEVADRARKAGMRVVVFNDKFTNRVEYGLPPLRNLLKKSEERGSISGYGVDLYLREINELSRQHPDMVILPGAEVGTFYYWAGSISAFVRDVLSREGLSRLLASGKGAEEKIGKFDYRQKQVDRGLKVVNFHKDMLVLGLDKADDYVNLPTVSNRKPLVLAWSGLLNLWPLPLLVFALIRLFPRRASPYPYALVTQPTAMPSVPERSQTGLRRARKSSLLLIVPSLLFLVNNFPFFQPKYDQYHGDQGSAPYQELIDYVNARGGLIFWSAPDISTGVFQAGPMLMETRPYSPELLNTRNYTGFAVFAEGMKSSGLPGGGWDKVLTEYVKGDRERPVWAIGELDYEDGDWIGETQTVFMLRALNRQDMLAALREGRIYAVTGSAKVPKPVLEKFQIWDAEKQHWAEMGETATVRGLTKIKIELVVPPGAEVRNLRLIREGQVVWNMEVTGSFTEIIELDYQREKGMTYYRLDLDSQLIANPVFCRFPTGRPAL